MTSSRKSSLLQGRTNAGFTLIEALCALVIIGLVMSLALPSLLHKPDGPQIEAAARQIAGMMRLARTEAIASNAPTLVMIDTDKRLITATGHQPVHIPPIIGIHLVAAKQEQRGGMEAGIRFYPDGTASGGDVVLSLHQRDTRISVNWLDGEARTVLGAGLNQEARTGSKR